MPDIAFANVAFTIERSWKTAGDLWQRIVAVAVGDGALTYPATGIPLFTLGGADPDRLDKDSGGVTLGGSAKSMGFPVLLLAMEVVDQVSTAAIAAFLVKADPVNRVLRFYFPTGSTLAAPAAQATDPIINAGGTAVTGSAAAGPFQAGRMKEFAGASTVVQPVTVRLLGTGR